MSKKIGILHCMKANEVCAACSCLRAVQNKTGKFAEYQEELILTAFFSCNGCQEWNSIPPREDKGMQEKVERLIQEGVENVHIGVCCKQQNGTLCSRIQEIQEMIQKTGISVKFGTH